MAERHFILQIMDEMEQNYRYNFNSVQVKTFCQLLKPVPTYLLRRAADIWLSTETRWLPKPSNLIEITDNLTQSGEVLRSTGEPAIPLWAQLEALKSTYYLEDELDCTRWQALIDLADYLERPHTAHSIKNTYNTLLQHEHQFQPQPVTYDA